MLWYSAPPKCLHRQLRRVPPQAPLHSACPAVHRARLYLSDLFSARDRQGNWPCSVAATTPIALTPLLLRAPSQQQSIIRAGLPCLSLAQHPFLDQDVAKRQRQVLSCAEEQRLRQTVLREDHGTGAIPRLGPTGDAGLTTPRPKRELALPRQIGSASGCCLKTEFNTTDVVLFSRSFLPVRNVPCRGKGLAAPGAPPCMGSRTLALSWYKKHTRSESWGVCLTCVPPFGCRWLCPLHLLVTCKVPSATPCNPSPRGGGGVA